MQRSVTPAGPSALAPRPSGARAPHAARRRPRRAGTARRTSCSSSRDGSWAKSPDPKTAALRQQGSLNPRPDTVADPLFASSDFFDPRDLVQVKYEMVRRARVDGQPVSHSATAFGFSRPSFYQAQALLARGGLAALVPKKPGPRRSHKLDPEVMHFLQQLRSDDASVRSTELARRVQARFGRTVHPRSVERALARQEKNDGDHPDLRVDAADAAVVAYEQLRRHALAGSPRGAGLGWLLLLREGVASWIDRCAAGVAPAAPSAAGDHIVAVAAVFPPLHVGVVHVLARIALSRGEAMSP